MNRARTHGSYAALLICMIVIISALPARADLGIAVGNYWTYEIEGRLEGFDLLGEVTYEITGIANSGGYEVFVLHVSGSGELSGGVLLLDMGLSGSFGYEGYEKRLTSNFSQLESSLEIAENIEIMGMEVSEVFSSEMVASPPINDYVGDEALSVGQMYESESDLTAEMCYDVSGIPGGVPESETVLMHQAVTLTVIAEGVEIEVPAGTFECWKIRADMVIDGELSTLLWYYSEEVGNYVKMQQAMFMELVSSDIELKSYGTRSDSFLSSLFGDNLWMLILTVIAVAVVVVVAVLLRGRGRQPAMASAPPTVHPLTPTPEKGVSPPPAQP